MKWQPIKLSNDSYKDFIGWPDSLLQFVDTLCFPVVEGERRLHTSNLKN